MATDLGMLTLTLSDINLDPLSAEQPTLDDRHRYLRFCLGDRTSALLSLHQIAAVFQLHGTEILRIPEMPNCIIGVCHWRGELLWLVDLDALVGYNSLLFANACEQDDSIEGLRSPTTIVVEVEEHYLGLVVARVDDVEVFDPNCIQPAIGLFPQNLEPFVQGYFPGDEGAVLDVDAIAQSPLWHTHSSLFF